MPALLRDAREVLAGLALLLAAAWLATAAFGAWRWMAGALGLLGLALAWAGVQRLRFRRRARGGGAGVVRLDERRLLYMGPLTGGMVDLDDLDRLDLNPTGRPAHWLLTAAGAPTLAVPVDAEGADALLGAFAALPGLRVEAVLAALARGRGPAVTLWRREGALAMPPRLAR